MIQLVAFRNSQGNMGFIQKDDDSISYCVDTDNPGYRISGSNSWQRWVSQVEAGYETGCTENITSNTITFYLNRYAEALGNNIVEFADVQKPGVYYPRIARTNIDFNYVTEDFLQDVRAYKNIQTSLDELFNYIEPSLENLTAYGHKIRELLILACTEVECLLVKMLIVNGYTKKIGIAHMTL